MILVYFNSIKNRIGNVWACYIDGQSFAYRRKDLQFFKNFFCRRQFCGLVSQKTFFSFAEQASTQISLAIKAPFGFLVSSF